MKIRDFYLSLLSENEDYFHIDNQSIGKIEDINIDKTADYVKIDFETTYGKQASLVAKYSVFKNWYANNVNKVNDVFKAFVQEFISKSEQTENPELAVNEIVDDDGNIMASTDKPNNATNSMVGSNNKWDLEKLYKSSIPKSTRFYSGGLGIGMVSW